MAGEWRNDVFIDGLFTFAIASLFVILALLIVAVHELVSTSYRRGKSRTDAQVPGPEAGCCGSGELGYHMTKYRQWLYLAVAAGRTRARNYGEI